MHTHKERNASSIVFIKLTSGKLIPGQMRRRKAAVCKVAISSSTKLCCDGQARADAASAHTHALINLLEHTHTHAHGKRIMMHKKCTNTEWVASRAAWGGLCCRTVATHSVPVSSRSEAGFITCLACRWSTIATWESTRVWWR